MSTPSITPLNQMGPQTTTSDVPNEIPPDQTGATPVSASGQPADSGQPAMASDETAQGYRPQPGRPQVQVVAAHPRASLFHNIMNVLGGGDKIQYNVDPQTGTMSQTRVPQSTGSLAKSVVAGALTGMLAGAGERGPGSEGRSFQKGGAAVSGQREMQDAQQKQQAEKNYENQQQAKVRAAQVMHLNMDTLHTAFNLSQAQDKELADHVEQFKGQVENIPKDSVVDSSVPSDEMMKKGYKAHGMAAIPDGYVPVYDQDGKPMKDENGVSKSQLTYTVYDPGSQGDLHKLVNVQDAAAAGIKPFDKATNFPEGATITHLAAQQINNEIADRKYILDTANRIQKAVDPKVPAMGMDKLKSALDADPTLADAFHKYKLTAGSSTEPDGRLDALRAKDPQAAGKLQQFFGDENLQAFKEAREVRLSSTKAMAGELAKEQTPKGQAEAASRELSDEEKRLKIAADKKKAAEEVTDDNLVDSMGTGKISAERMGYILGRKPELLEKVVKKYPDFDSAKAQSYPATYADFTHGKTSRALNSGGTALRHLKELQDLNTPASMVPGTPAHAAYENKADTLASELSTFYKGGGAPTNEDIKGIKDTLMAKLTFNRAAAIRTQAQSMGDKLDSYETTWANAAPSKSYQAPMPFISKEAKDSRAILDPIYKQRYSQETTKPQTPQIPAGGRPVIVNGQTIGYTTDGTTMTRF